jgi:hypothetical protein
MHSQKRKKPLSQKTLSEFEPGEKHLYKEKLKKQEKLKWKELEDELIYPTLRCGNDDQG